jgi:hypothetical protein
MSLLTGNHLSTNLEPSQQKAKCAQTCLRLSIKSSIQSELPAACPKHSRSEFAQAFAGWSGRGGAQPSAEPLHPFLQVLLLECSGPLAVSTGTAGAPLGCGPGGHPGRNLPLGLGRWLGRERNRSSNRRLLFRPGLVNRVPNHLAGNSAVLSGERKFQIN